MKERPMTADEVFVTLIGVAKEDPKIHSFIMTVITLNDFDRKSLINTFIKEMSLKGAPAEFIKAIAALREPLLVEKVKELLQQER